MTFILICRNPRTGDLVPIVKDDHGNLARFDTECDAASAAGETTLCRAWGYRVVEVDE